MAEVIARIDERNVQRRVPVCPVPTDGATNASYVLGYTAGKLTSITKTVAGVAYVRTITWTAGVPTAISAWSVV